MTRNYLLPTAYVVRREGYVLARVCPSVCLSTPRGGTPSRSRQEVPQPGPAGGGGYPSQVQPGGPHLAREGTPPWVPPHQTLMGGPLLGGYSPHQTWLVGPLLGVPHLGYPPQTWLGGTPAKGG